MKTNAGLNGRMAGIAAFTRNLYNTVLPTTSTKNDEFHVVPRQDLSRLYQGYARQSPSNSNCGLISLMNGLARLHCLPQLAFGHHFKRKGTHKLIFPFKGKSTHEIIIPKSDRHQRINWKAIFNSEEDSIVRSPVRGEKGYKVFEAGVSRMLHGGELITYTGSINILHLAKMILGDWITDGFDINNTGIRLTVSKEKILPWLNQFHSDNMVIVVGTRKPQNPANTGLNYQVGEAKIKYDHYMTLVNVIHDKTGNISHVILTDPFVPQKGIKISVDDLFKEFTAFTAIRLDLNS